MNVSADNAIHPDASNQLENITSDADVDTEISTEGVETQLSPRQSAIEAIAAQRNKSFEAELNELNPQPAQPAAADPATGDDQLARQLGQDERATQFAADSSLIKVKVDGEELELPLAELVKSYQKDATATRRLQQATEILRNAEQQVSKSAQVGDKINPPEAAPTDEERMAQIKGAFSKLYEGDEEGAAAAMLKLFEGAKATQKPIDAAQVAAEVKQQLAVESAYGQVQTDYPEIFANDERGVVLGKAAYERMVAKESIGIPRAQALRESTEEVATIFGLGKKEGRPQSEQVQRTARDTKLERKQNLDIPGSANAVAGNKQSPAEVQNVSSVIQEMAKSRLGQSLSRS